MLHASTTGRAASRKPGQRSEVVADLPEASAGGEQLCDQLTVVGDGGGWDSGLAV
ncbi:hypothetical protein AB0D99_14415 [Streptomyces sp. NPDC047971]|uniref:hypothetical protein n=1 Tax=Streptomyces sp. NPDC047971 TaxID=3154499 RepID=UPI0033F1B7C7